MTHVKYFWDELEDNVVREYDENNNTLASYTTEPTLYGSVLSQDRNGEKRHFQFDGPGNTSELTDESGNATDMQRYSAFGELSQGTGITEFSNGFGGSAGLVSNRSISLILGRQRLFDPQFGRWLSPNPVDRDIQSIGYQVPNRQSAQSPWGLAKSKAKNCAIVMKIADPPGLMQDMIDIAQLPEKKEDAFLFGACTEKEIVDFLTKNHCCRITFYGHQGTTANCGGLIAQCGSPPINRRVFPNPSLEGKIRSLLGKCYRAGPLRIHSCGDENDPCFKPTVQCIASNCKCRVIKVFNTGTLDQGELLCRPSFWNSGLGQAPDTAQGRPEPIPRE